jgi:hypothetical protein
MTFEVKKPIFEKGLILLSSETNVVSLTKLPKQHEWLEEISFDLTEDADDYHGKYFENYLWESPNSESVGEFFQTRLKKFMTRLESYDRDQILTEDEQKQFKDYIINRLIEDGDYPGIYTGEIHYKQNSITVFTSRGGFSWSNYSVDLLGVFNNIQEGDKELFNPEEGVLY